MPTHAALFVAALALAGVPALVGQAPPGGAKPGPEHQKLGYFAGRWRSDAEMRPGPTGVGGKVTGTSTCDWFAGGFHLVCRSEGRGPAGDTRAIWIMGYNGEQKRYTYFGVDNSGMGGDIALGELVGDTWKWEGESTMAGQPVKGRYTIKQVSPDSWTWVWEMSVGNGPWGVLGQGTETRIKP